MVVGGKAAAAFQVVGQLLCSLQAVPIAHGHRRGQAFAMVQNIVSGRPLHGFVAQDAVDVVGLAQPCAVGAAELHQFGHRGVFLFQRGQLLQRGGVTGQLHQPAGCLHAGQQNKIVPIQLGAQVGIIVVLAQAQKAVAVLAEQRHSLRRGQVPV